MLLESVLCDNTYFKVVFSLSLFSLFLEILKSVSTEHNEIQFIEDGTWSLIKNNKETHMISSTPSGSRITLAGKINYQTFFFLFVIQKKQACCVFIYCRCLAIDRH